VWFGERWITSIFDLFEENVRYFPALLPMCDEEDPEEVLAAGGVPKLAELRLHGGRLPLEPARLRRERRAPHLRVENRVLPAGPTVVDIVANAAFYYGLVEVLCRQERPIWSQMSFAAAEENFHAGARDGIDAPAVLAGSAARSRPRSSSCAACCRWPTRGSRSSGSTAATATACSASSSSAA
jgi:hypothetical protein